MTSPSYTPFPGTSSQDADENEWWLRREISLIQNLLKEEGEQHRGDIGDKLGCKYWRPMRFRAALKGGRRARRLPQDRPQPLRVRGLGSGQPVRSARRHLRSNGTRHSRAR
jgi:hypothetical protein